MNRPGIRTSGTTMCTFSRAIWTTICIRVTRIPIGRVPKRSGLILKNSSNTSIIRCLGPGSNRGPHPLQGRALPTELPKQPENFTTNDFVILLRASAGGPAHPRLKFFNRILHPLILLRRTRTSSLKSIIGLEHLLYRPVQIGDVQPDRCGYDRSINDEPDNHPYRCPAAHLAKQRIILKRKAVRLAQELYIFRAHGLRLKFKSSYLCDLFEPLLVP